MQLLGRTPRQFILHEPRWVAKALKAGLFTLCKVSSVFQEALSLTLKLVQIGLLRFDNLQRSTLILRFGIMILNLGMIAKGS